MEQLLVTSMSCKNVWRNLGLTLNITLSRLRLTSSMTVWDHVCMLEASTHAAKLLFITGHKPPVFNLLRGRFWGFSPRRGNMLHWWGWNLARMRGPLVPNFTPISAMTRVWDPKNWNFCSDLTKMWNINTPQGRIPCTIFTKFAEFVPPIQDALAVKIWLDLLGVMELWGF